MPIEWFDIVTGILLLALSGLLVLEKFLLRSSGGGAPHPVESRFNEFLKRRISALPVRTVSARYSNWGHINEEFLFHPELLKGTSINGSNAVDWVNRSSVAGQTGG